MAPQIGQWNVSHWGDGSVWGPWQQFGGHPAARGAVRSSQRDDPTLPEAAPPHPFLMTHSRPLARPATGLRLRRIPFVASQATQVPRGGEGKSFPRILEIPSIGLVGNPFELTKSVIGKILSPGERIQVRASVKTKYGKLVFCPPSPKPSPQGEGFHVPRC